MTKHDRYNPTEKGRARRRRYRLSVKGKAAEARYRNTVPGMLGKAKRDIRDNARKRGTS